MAGQTGAMGPGERRYGCDGIRVPLTVRCEPRFGGAEAVVVAGKSGRGEVQLIQSENQKTLVTWKLRQ
jgi:hypothetical protein